MDQLVHFERTINEHMIRVSNQEHRSLVERELTYILNLKLLPIMVTQIQLQSPIEQL